MHLDIFSDMLYKNVRYSGGKNIWSPVDYVRLPTDKEMISL